MLHPKILPIFSNIFAEIFADIFAEISHCAIVKRKTYKKIYSWMKSLFRDNLLCLAATSSSFKHQQ